MRNLIAVPVILLAVTLQSAIVSRVTLLSGIADLPLVMLAAWAMQEEVETAWHWAIAAGVLVGFVSGLSWVVPVLSYLFVVALAQVLQRRVWQAPLLAMFSITFLGTLGLSFFSLVVLQFSGIALPVVDVFGLVTLPGILLNMLLAVPVFAVMRDLARWVYPASEVE
jgi:cytochrome b subunit of formate dehydrogenase